MSDTLFYLSDLFSCLVSIPPIDFDLMTETLCVQGMAILQDYNTYLQNKCYEERKTKGAWVFKEILLEEAIYAVF